MAKRYQNVIRFSRSKSRAEEAEFTGAEVSSNGGAMLLAEADRRMGLTQAAAEAIGDDRRRRSVVHATRDIIRQRVYGLILGHEDLNDHKRLRLDPALQAAVKRDGAMASPSTLCRTEGILPSIGPLEWALHREIRDLFHGRANVETGGPGARKAIE